MNILHGLGHLSDGFAGRGVLPGGRRSSCAESIVAHLAQITCSLVNVAIVAFTPDSPLIVHDANSSIVMSFTLPLGPGAVVLNLSTG